MKQIPLSGKRGIGKSMTVDDADYDELSKMKWYIRQANGKGYPQIIHVFSYGVYVTRFVLGNIPEGMHVDHINRNPYDFRRENLRIVTPQQNRWNTSKRTRWGGKSTSSKYIGVYKRKDGKRKKVWVACLRIGGKPHRLGSYLTEEEAARAYDRECIKQHAEFAVLNFPNDQVKR